MTIEVRHADFLALALGAYVDRFAQHVITDPPYLERTHANQRSGSGGKVSTARPLSFASITELQRREYADRIADITKRWAIVFCDDVGFEGWRHDLESAGLEYVRQLVWVRGSRDVAEGGGKIVTKGRKGAPQFTGDRPGTGHELMVLCHSKKQAKRWNGRYAARDGSGGLTGGDDVYYADIETEGRIHDAQKPLALMRELIRDFTDPDEGILDPFCGSGTTLVAARFEGRNALGLEAHPKHAAAARRRLGC